MTQRERFFSQMSARPELPGPNWEFSYWETTLTEWHKQGLPQEIDTPQKAYRHFGIEGFHFDEGDISIHRASPFFGGGGSIMFTTHRSSSSLPGS